MSKMVVHHWNAAEDGQLTKENMKAKLRKMGYSYVDYEFNPGTSFPEHTHGQEKMDCIVSGQLSFEMFGEKIILSAGDCLEVPKNVPHSASVCGNERVVFMDATRK